MANKKKLIVMVSSTVYGIEELLERIYAILTRFGYEVWMSHKGTVPVISTRSAFDNCLHSVEQCDLFLSLITTHYGSGKEYAAALSITHRELLRAIELNKPRWILAHDQGGVRAHAAEQPWIRRHEEARGSRIEAERGHRRSARD